MQQRLRRTNAAEHLVDDRDLRTVVCMAVIKVGDDHSYSQPGISVCCICSAEHANQQGQCFVGADDCWPQLFGGISFPRMHMQEVAKCQEQEHRRVLSHLIWSLGTPRRSWCGSSFSLQQTDQFPCMLRDRLLMMIMSANEMVWGANWNLFSQDSENDMLPHSGAQLSESIVIELTCTMPDGNTSIPSELKGSYFTD